MSRTQVSDALVAELMKLPEGTAGERKALRAAIGCSAGELRVAIDRLRFAGKIEWDRLALRPSLRAALTERVEQSVGGTREGLPAAPDLGAVAKGERQVEPAGAGPRAPAAENLERVHVEHRASGAELAAEIRAWCEHVGIALWRFGPLIGRSPQIFKSIERAARPQVNTILRVRKFIAAHPDAAPAASAKPAAEPARAAPVHAALAPARPIVADAARAEAEAAAARRRAARTTGGTRPVDLARDALGDPTLGERVTTMLAETPGDLIQAVTRRHPELWARVLRLARRLGQRPGPILFDVIECGLGVLEAGPVRSPVNSGETRDAA